MEELPKIGFIPKIDFSTGLHHSLIGLYLTETPHTTNFTFIISYLCFSQVNAIATAVAAIAPTVM
jgi:hypothetical protein